MSSKPKIAWIGTGIMGGPMALHLAEHGYDVSAYNRTFEKVEKLGSKVKAFKTIKETVMDADVVFSIVGYPKDVDEVIHEVFKHAKKGTTIIDMTTSSPNLAKMLYEEGLKLGFNLLDAPVTGGDVGAKNGVLSVMVGGKEEIFNQVLPLFKTFGKTITYIGKSGNGQYAKLANQIAIAGTLVGVVESLYYAINHKLNLQLLHQILSGGSAASHQVATNALRIIQNDFEPGFYIKHFLKDLNLAIESAQGNLLVTTQVRDMLQTLVDHNYADKGTQALILYYLDGLANLK